MYKKQVIGCTLAFLAFIALVYGILEVMIEGTAVDGAVIAGGVATVVCMIVGTALVISAERSSAQGQH